MAKQKKGLTTKERRLIEQVAQRWSNLRSQHRIPTTVADRKSVEDALALCHTQGVPLQLERMATWPRDFDVLHDVAGLARHMDPRTGELRDCFLPRFAVPAKERV